MKYNVSCLWVSSLVFLIVAVSGCSPHPETKHVSAPYVGPIIDMHLHAMGAADQGPPPLSMCVGFGAQVHDPSIPWGAAFMAALKNPTCDNPIVSSISDEALRDETLEILKRLDILGVLSGPRERVAAWKALAPDNILAGHEFNLMRDDYTPQEIADYFASGGFEVFGEISNQYSGIAADDERMRGFWAMAAEHDIPVGIHIGVGPPGAPYLFSGYRARLHSPLALEEILVRHSTLRVYIMHAAWPLRDELKAMLYAHPQVYVDTGILQTALTRAEYYDFLEDLVRAGFGKRIMFGSDQMVWPGLIEEGVKAINEAPFLSTEQKAEILHDNAARFLRMSSP